MFARSAAVPGRAGLIVRIRALEASTGLMSAIAATIVEVRGMRGGAMSELAIERRLIEAFADARTSVEENPDLFARVTQSLEDAIARRRYRWRVAGYILAFIAANAGLALAFSYSDRYNRVHINISLINTCFTISFTPLKKLYF